MAPLLLCLIGFHPLRTAGMITRCAIRYRILVEIDHGPNEATE
jgi:hypothetical protein